MLLIAGGRNITGGTLEPRRNLDQPLEAITQDGSERRVGCAERIRVRLLAAKQLLGKVRHRGFDRVIRIRGTIDHLSSPRFPLGPARVACPLRKTIYSLQPDLRELLSAANQRYLAFISDIDDPTAGIKALNKISETKEQAGRTLMLIQRGRSRSR
ncbi:MAG: hypothetical protein U1E76_02660 [Planctomycetota bacterium]